MYCKNKDLVEDAYTIFKIFIGELARYKFTSNTLRKLRYKILKKSSIEIFYINIRNRFLNL